MREFQTVFGAVIPVLAVILTGFAVRRIAWLTGEADHSLLRLTINLLFPCLILDSAIGNPALQRLDNLLLAPAVGAGTFLLSLGVARIARSASGLVQPHSQRTFVFTVGLYNYGFMAIPLAWLLFGQDTVGVLFVHNVGVELALWTAGIMVLSGTSSVANWRKLFNPPLLAIVIALVINFSGLAPHLPEMLVQAVRLLAQCAIPLSLILVGATVADHLEGFHSAPGWRVMLAGSILRMGLLPLLFLLIAKFLPASDMLKRVIVLQAAMPSAVLPIVLAKHYHGDPATALRVALATSAVGLITIPLWIRAGLAWVGLDTPQLP